MLNALNTGLDSADITEKAKYASQHAVPFSNHGGLLNQLHQVLPEYTFSHVMTRGGWYRPGGIISQDGTEKISDNLETWIHEKSAGDVNQFLDNYSSEGLLATHFKGQTHYLVAPTGDKACDFLQLEVEELHEVTVRQLIDENYLAETLEELIDPLEFTQIDEVEISAPRYVFRRIVSMRDFMATQQEEHDDKQSNIMRFFNDWDNSSAAEHASFCQHWVLSIREYVDRYGEPKVIARPVSTLQDDVPELNQEPLPRGADLAVLIHSFDRKVGYPMAWFFFMLTHKAVSHQLAESIHQDLMGAYAYLPLRDLRILINWYDSPYTF